MASEKSKTANTAPENNQPSSRLRAREAFFCVCINVAFPRRSLAGSIVDFETTPGGSGGRIRVWKLIVDGINKTLDAAR